MSSTNDTPRRHSYTVSITVTMAVTADESDNPDAARADLIRSLQYDLEQLVRPGTTSVSTDIQLTELRDPWADTLPIGRNYADGAAS